MTDTMALPKARTRPRRSTYEQSKLSQAAQAWYDGLDPETKAAVDKLVDWLIMDRHMANESCNFGKLAALEVIAVALALREGWLEMRLRWRSVSR